MTNRIITVAEETFMTEPGVITSETNNLELEEWDSLGSVFFITALEKEFNIKIDTSDTFKIRSISTAEEVIKKSLSKIIIT